MSLFVESTIKADIPSVPLAIAVSGGADSMALALLARELVPPEILVAALHVDHRLRPESAAEAKQVQAWLTGHGIPCHILTIAEKLKEQGGNIQSAARKARYQLMLEWCVAHAYRYLLTGHHQGDQAETILMRLARGSGIDGLSGIPRERHTAEGVTILRPLLNYSKQALQEYVQEKGQRWLEDPTNSQPVYQRNRWRTLMPMLAAEGMDEASLAELASHMARAADYLQQQMHDWLATHATIEPQRISFQQADFAALHEEIALRVMRYALERLGNADKPLRFESLLPLVRDMCSDAPFRNRTLHHCHIRLKRGVYAISPEI